MDQKPKILIVDDDEDICKLIELVLSELDDYDIITAHDGLQALTLIEREQPNLIILDLLLPGVDGFEICRQVKEKEKYIPLIAITAMAEQSKMLEMFEIGADDFIRKPFEPEVLRAKVRIMLRLEGLHSRLKRQFNSMVISFTNVLELKDKHTKGHSDKVSRLAFRLGQELGLENKQLSQIETAALLHDIGKILIEDAILSKPGPLTAREYERIKEHPVLADKILVPIDEFSEMRTTIRHHHERWDGKGYPDGLAGDEIPYSARIVSIADCLDAMTSYRSYREAMPLAKALGLMDEQRGRQFDPQLLDQSLRFIRKHKDLGDLMSDPHPLV